MLACMILLQSRNDYFYLVDVLRDLHYRPKALSMFESAILAEYNQKQYDFRNIIVQNCDFDKPVVSDIR
jgi:hypothetical protein